MPYQFAIVILNWNAADDTIDCVSNIIAWQTLKPTIIVVDNASLDNSPALIQSECPGIHLIRNQENLGFAGGSNRGIQKAVSMSEQPVMLLNNDASIAEEDALTLLDTLQNNPQIGFVGPLLYDAEQRERLLSAGGKNPVKHHHTRITILEPGAPIRPVEYVSGTVVLINPTVFRRVGLLDEDYFFSTELADLCMRARQQDYLSVINTTARAYHTVSRSSALRDTLYVYYIIRNRFIFIGNAPYKFKSRFYAFWTVYGIALTLKLRLTGHYATATAVWLGLKDGLLQRFGGQNERVLAACHPDLANRPEYR